LQDCQDLHTLDLDEREARAREEDSYLVAEREDLIAVQIGPVSLPLRVFLLQSHNQLQ
jgi:hypothetical protein